MANILLSFGNLIHDDWATLLCLVFKCLINVKIIIQNYMYHIIHGYKEFSILSTNHNQPHDHLHQHSPWVRCGKYTISGLEIRFYSRGHSGSPLFRTMGPEREPGAHIQCKNCPRAPDFCKRGGGGTCKIRGSMAPESP